MNAFSWIRGLSRIIVDNGGLWWISGMHADMNVYRRILYITILCKIILYVPSLIHIQTLVSCIHSSEKSPAQNKLLLASLWSPFPDWFRTGWHGEKDRDATKGGSRARHGLPQYSNQLLLSCTWPQSTYGCFRFGDRQMFAHPNKRTFNYDYSGLPQFGQQHKTLNCFRKNSTSKSLKKSLGPSCLAMRRIGLPD